MQSHKTVSTNHKLSEEKGEPKRYRTEVLPLTSLTPYGFTQQSVPTLRYTRRHLPSAVPWFSEDFLLVRCRRKKNAAVAAAVNGGDD